jgi:hypothetical protein
MRVALLQNRRGRGCRRRATQRQPDPVAFDCDKHFHGRASDAAHAVTPDTFGISQVYRADRCKTRYSAGCPISQC